MLTSKQRAALRGMANTMEPIFQLGKSGVSPEFVQMVSDALEKRELIKIAVLSNCTISPKEAGGIIAERAKAEVVQVIGKKITLFRKSEKHTEISDAIKA